MLCYFTKLINCYRFLIIQFQSRRISLHGLQGDRNRKYISFLLSCVARRNARFAGHANRESHTDRRHKTRFSERLGGKSLFDVTRSVRRRKVRESTTCVRSAVQNKAACINPKHTYFHMLNRKHSNVQLSSTQ